MKIIADTNILVRAVMDDDSKQGAAARAALEQADTIALSSVTLSELVWVLSSGYKVPAPEVAAFIRRLIDSQNVECNRPVVEAGLAMLDVGGDFADGAIIAEGQQLGGEVFVSFDKKAVKRAQAFGSEATFP